MSEETAITPSNPALLPVRYEAACKALAECHRIDECKDWADKAAAMRVYAKQAKDDSLQRMAIRIQARASRRCGELLKQVPAANGANQNIREGGYPKVTRESVASAAGLSEHQRKTAQRVASVPEESFNAQVESEKPPTISALAAQGTARQVASPPIDSRKMEATAAISRFGQFCAGSNPHELAALMGLADSETLAPSLNAISNWLDSFITNLPLRE